MNQILEIDADNQVAIVQPGVTLADLDTPPPQKGWCTPSFPAS